jgi:ABC-2 type transport system ATP-binding protein
MTRPMSSRYKLITSKPYLLVEKTVWFDHISMNVDIEITNLDYAPRGHAQILNNLNAVFAKGSFVALLGENGAGKTTLLDMIMGFKAPSAGELRVRGELPICDQWQQRQSIVYLSEKMDIPGDWTVRQYLQFNKYFYNHYSENLEQELIQEFRVNESSRLGSMSAGEVRRVQIVGALATEPSLIVVDEITAVLDIVGRRRFMARLYEQNQKRGCTVILATNILEELERYISDVLIMKNGKISVFEKLEDFLKNQEKSNFVQLVANHLEAT